jgi:hypothetical protein
MRLRCWNIIMTVPMMFVVNVAVFMLKHVVLMLMLVPLDKVQPKPAAHKRSRQKQLERQGLVEQGECENRADEGRQREIGAVNTPVGTPGRG